MAGVVELYEPVQRGLCCAAPPAQIEALIALARFLHARGMTPSYGPGDHGNVSCRTPGGCLISARETSKATMRAEDVIEVLGYERTPSGVRVPYAGARPPSTDALVHLMIYELRPDVAAVAHGHDEAVLRKAGPLSLPVTQVSARSNSPALVEEVRRLCRDHDYIVTRDHGFIALGATLSAAQELLARWQERARAG